MAEFDVSFSDEIVKSIITLLIEQTCGPREGIGACVAAIQEITDQNKMPRDQALELIKEIWSNLRIVQEEEPEHVNGTSS